MSQEKKMNEQCEVCRGEGTIAYKQAWGGYSQSATCYKCEGAGVDAQRAPTLAGCLHPHTCPELKRCCAPGLCNHKGEIP